MDVIWFARFYSVTRFMLSRSKVPEMVWDSAFFESLNLVYSAFGVVLLVVPEPETHLKNTKYNNLP